MLFRTAGMLIALVLGAASMVPAGAQAPYPNRQIRIKSMAFDPLTAFAPISTMAQFDLLLLVRADWPPIAEMGLPGYEGILWNAIMAPAGTPQAVIDRLAAASAKAARAPEIIERLQRDGIEPVGGTPAEFAALIARELPQWRELAKAANIRLQ